MQDNKDEFDKTPNSFYVEEIKKENKFKKKLIKGFSSIFLSITLGFALSASYVFVKELMLPKFSQNIRNDDFIVGSIETSSNTTDLKNIIKKVTPSIVTITTTSQTRDFFNIPIESEGAGSGIIFHKTDSKTYILTNNHVIENASQVGVAIEENDPIFANLVGKDAKNDLAVISIDNKDLKKAGISEVTVAKFGDSSKMQEGDSVIAIGNALGEGKTATLGIISTTAKDINIDGSNLNVLQTTAAINPGNSGGALINSKGEVVGINTAKIARNNVKRIGYSIASNIALPIVENIMNNTNPPSLGIYVADANQQQGNLIGALVVKIIEGGSAHKAGILPNDVITSVEEVPIFNSEQLVEKIKTYKVGETVKIKLLRDGNVMTIRVRLQQSSNTSTSF